MATQNTPRPTAEHNSSQSELYALADVIADSLSRTPALQPKQWDFRYVIGVSRAF